MAEGTYPHAPKRYTDSKYGFTFQYPLIRHWTLEGEGGGGIKFKNKFLGSYLLVMASQIGSVVENIHDLVVQVDLVKGIVKTMKRINDLFAKFKFGSAENIVNTHNQIKGFKVIFRFKEPGRDMLGKSITYTHKQIRYDILAYAAAKNFDTEDNVFFEPIAKSFTFET